MPGEDARIAEALALASDLDHWLHILANTRTGSPAYREAQHSLVRLVLRERGMILAALRRPDGGRSDREGDGIPEGWKLVPIKPTPAMAKAGDMYTNCGGACGNRAGAAAYAAMLAAAPASVPVPQQTPDTSTRPEPARPGGRDA